MSHSLLGADRNTHLKIVAVALISATLIVAVGVHARITDTATATARIDGPALKAGKPSAFSSSETNSVR